MKKRLPILSLMVALLLAAGCQSAPKADLPALDKVHAAVKTELGEDYFPDRALTAEELETLMGVKAADVESFVAEMPNISMRIDTFIAVRAKAGKGEAVKKALEAYRTFLVEESMQYPMNLAKVNAATVVAHGDDVYFLMLGKMDETSEDIESDEAKAFAEGEVTRVKAVVDGFYK